MFRLPRCHPCTFITMLIMIGTIIGITATLKYLIVDFNNRYTEQTCQVRNCTSVTELCMKTQCQDEGCPTVSFPCYSVTFQLEAVNTTTTITKMYYELPTMCAFNTISCWYNCDDHKLLLQVPPNIVGYVTMSILSCILGISVLALIGCIYYLEQNGCDGPVTPWGSPPEEHPDDSFVTAMNRRILDREHDRLLSV